MTSTDLGMAVFEDYPLLVAAKDLQINCACDGPDLVEMNCPVTLIEKTPNVHNYKHIDMCNDNIVLKMTSPYYSQIQGQLAASKRSYCDLFIFSFKGNLTVPDLVVLQKVIEVWVPWFPWFHPRYPVLITAINLATN